MTTQTTVEALAEISRRLAAPNPNSDVHLAAEAVLLIHHTGLVADAVDRYRRYGTRAALTETVYDLALYAVRLCGHIDRTLAENTDVFAEAKKLKEYTSTLTACLVSLGCATSHAAWQLTCIAPDLPAARRTLIGVVGECAAMLDTDRTR